MEEKEVVGLGGWVGGCEEEEEEAYLGVVGAKERAALDGFVGHEIDELEGALFG